MDETRLPDPWGYDYVEPRVLSPYTKRSLLIALAPILFILLILALVVMFS